MVVDFQDLASRDSRFREALISTKAKCDKGKPLASVMDDRFNLSLTRAILKVHFGYDYFFLPAGHLIPPVPNRQCYLDWLAVLLDDHVALPLGLDVGTGASCIYPLLGAKMGWRFLATDVDAESVANATKIVR